MHVQEKTPAIEAGIGQIRKAIALNYGGAKMESGWSTDTSQYVKLVSDSEDRSRFLSEVTHIFVADTSGPLRRFSIDGMSEQRLEERNPQNLTQFDGREYNLTIVDNDYVIPYADLDSYTKVGNPRQFIENVNRDMAIKMREDELWIAFNGTSRATWASDPNGLDIDKGWLQRMKEKDAEEPGIVISEIRSGSGIVTVGPTRWVLIKGDAVDKGSGKVGLPSLAHDIPAGAMVQIYNTTNYNGKYLVEPETSEDEFVITAAFTAENEINAKAACVPDFANLDELTSETVTSIAPNKRQNLKAIMSDTMAGAEKAALFASIAGTPTEKILAEQALGTIGSLTKRTPFGFPDGKLLITNPANLQIYLHNVWRRSMKDSEKDRGLNTWSERKRDFIVFDYNRARLIENIVFLKANPGVSPA